MPRKLEGSCRCGAVHFSVESQAPYPYQLCYCSICRKTAGGGGFAINLSGRSKSLKVRGRKAIGVFRARIEDETGHCETSTGERSFCTRCGTALWLYDPGWPELVHPFASAIDTRLPVPPSRVHLMLKFKAPWVRPDIGRGDGKFQLYPKQSIEEWHRRRGLWIE
ncbi:MAG TPA: GFA family protein [Rhizomicrobium sp.]|jgi:hypothetical protein|nr:GFA family protein [Rhizomicrobium sp.]